MSTLSNEEKLDIFFNYLKELEPKDHTTLFRNGFNSGGLVVNSQECELYFRRFKDDGLIEQQSKQSYIITLEGQFFKGYTPQIQKVKRSVDKIEIYTLIGIFIAFVGTCFTIAEYFKPNDTEVPVKISIPLTIKIDSSTQAKQSKIDTSVVVKPNE